MNSDLLREERIQHGWSQAQLAEELGVDTRTVRRWERGQAVPFPYYRQKLAVLFGKTPEELGLPSGIDESNTTEEGSSSATQSNSSGTQAPTPPSNQADTLIQPSHFSENIVLEISPQPIEIQRANPLEDHEPESAHLGPIVDEHVPLQDEPPAAQPEIINALVGHVQARQESMHTFGDQIFAFRSLWDFRIHMRHQASSQPSKRFLRPLLLIASILLVAAVIIVAILPILHQQPSGDTHIPDNYAPPNYILTIPTIDPSLQTTALHLQQAFNAVYPQLVNRFALDPVTAPRNVTLIFSSNLPSPAAVSNTTILLSLDWIQQHPNDVGLLTYELTRLLEQYPSGAPTWFSNGMANYARDVYGPADDNWSLPDQVQPQDSYKQGGGVTARFLLWLEQYTRLDIVDQLNHALQTGLPFSSTFQTLTHHTVDQLWHQFKGYPVITLLPNQVYKTVLSRKPFYRSSMSAANSEVDTFASSYIPVLNPSNFAMQADMTIISGGGGGFVFRIDAANPIDGDRLRVSPDGTYDLVNQIKPLASGFSFAIKQGLKQTNQITIIEQKYTIYLYINKQFITQVDDPNFSYGKLGVLALDWGSPTNVRYEHVQVF